MTALAAERLTKRGALYPTHFNLPIEANTRIFKGSQVALNAAGNAVPAASATAVMIVGMASATYDNRIGSATLSGLANATTVEVQPGMSGWDQDGSITQAILPCEVYALDDATVSANNLGGAFAKAGIAVEITTDASVAARKVMVLQGPIAVSPSTIQKRSLPVLFSTTGMVVAALTATLNIGAVLPANSRIIGYSVQLVTPFTGGAVATCVVAIGTTGDPVALVSSADVLSAAVDGAASALTIGKAPHKLFAAAGAQLQAKFTTTVANLNALTAGSAVIDVLFEVLA